MHTIWVGIDPRPEHTRVLVMAGPGETLLKARLQPLPASRVALPMLLEALALWQGRPVRAALVVGESDGSSRARFAEDAFATTQSALFTLEFVPAARPPRRRDDISGMGAFGDLRQLLLFETTR